jgi:hypothetical protein
LYVCIVVKVGGEKREWTTTQEWKYPQQLSL